MSTVEVRNLELTFYDKNRTNRVLRDISFNVDQGEIVSLLGLSGAGKTSLLRTLNLLQRPDSGQIRINGHEITNLSQKEIQEMRKRIGVVFQHFNLFRNKTVYDNIAFPLGLQKVSRKRIEEKVRKTAGEMNLTDKLTAYPSTLSGGEKQRVAIARAMIVDPNLLLLDEPTSALDPKTKLRILNTVNALNQKHHMTIITVTHDMDVVKTLSDKVAYLKKGRLTFFGAPQDFFAGMGHEISLDFDLPEAETGIIRAKNDAQLITVYFWGEKASQPVLWNLSRLHDVQLNIISGNIENLKHGKYGHLECEIRGNSTADFITDLKREVFKVEVRRDV